MNVRARAALILHRVIEQQQPLKELLSASSSSQLKALCYGVCRHYFSLSAQCQVLLTKPIKKNKRSLFYLLLVALFEINDGKRKPYAIVSESVNACGDLGMSWARGLVNATLRRALSNQDAVKSVSVEAQWEHPHWLIEQFKTDWPSAWQTILSANNQHPPLTVRVNPARQTREHYLERLTTHGITAWPVADIPSAVNLEPSITVDAIPGFAEGDVSLQDASAQCCQFYCHLEHDQTLLDACAAPGGKTCLIAERYPSNTITAIDVQPARVKKIQENITRIGLNNVRVQHADALSLAERNEQYDFIILDAPCSGTGIIRRQVDIKCHRQSQDVRAINQLQRRLLATLWSCLKPGGTLLYMTCSIIKTENEILIGEFLQQHPTACEQKITLPYGQACSVGWQILPGEDNLDGFYFAQLKCLSP